MEIIYVIYSFCVARYQMTHGLVPVCGPGVGTSAVNYHVHAIQLYSNVLIKHLFTVYVQTQFPSKLGHFLKMQ